MPEKGYIPASGQVSVGTGANTSGVTRSVQDLADIKSSSSTLPAPNSKITFSQLRNWYRTYVDPSGDPGNEIPGSGSSFHLGLHKVTIHGCRVRTRNETSHQYATNDDAQLRIRGMYGSGSYSVRDVRYNDLIYMSGSSEAHIYKNWRAGATYPSGMDQTFDITDTVTGAFFQLEWKPGYAHDSNNRIYETSTMMDNGGDTGGSWPFYWSSSDHDGSWSNYKYFYHQKPDTLTQGHA